MEHLSNLDKYEIKTINSSIDIRGTYRLNTIHRELFLFEIQNIFNLQKDYSNVSVLLPFLRTYKEAWQAIKILKKHSIKNIGCMIEVPSILFVSREINLIFDFFIIGVSDFSQLIQGCDRNSFKIEEETIQLIAAMLIDYFFPYISTQKKIYISSKELFKLLSHKNITHNILLLT
jgi:pyruvate,water dikinase